MAFRIDVSPVAAEDIGYIFEYLAARNREGALNIFRAIEEAILRLADHPFSAPKAEVANRDDLRRISVPPYTVFYRIVSDTVEVVRVLHSARDLEDPKHFSGL
ncbi:MAG: type II toxin-antitoxin system RelE/ParE family toxin [Mesorhizobium sp.]